MGYGLVNVGQVDPSKFDEAGSAQAVQENLTDHIEDKENPHEVTAEQAGALPTAGGTMTGPIAMSGQKITGLGTPSDDSDAARKADVDAAKAESSPLSGLPTNDIRTYAVRTGESISAGDVVNIGPENEGDTETVYKDSLALDNVERVFDSSAINACSICKIDSTRTVAAYGISSVIRRSLIDNATGNKIDHTQNSGVESVQFTKITQMNAGVCLEMKSLTTSSYSDCMNITPLYITAGGTLNSGGPVNNDAIPEDRMLGVTSGDIVALSNNTALAIYNLDGLKARVCSVSGEIPTEYHVASWAGSEVALLGVSQANYISACRIPDEGSDKRVCICFSDTGDGNKGKSVIATIDSSNAVTFGDVLTVGTTAVANYIGCSFVSGVIVCLFQNVLYAVDINTFSVLGQVDVSDDLSMGLNLCGYSALNSKFVVLGANKTGSSSGQAQVYEWDGEAFSKGTPYIYRSTSFAPYPAAAQISAEKIMVAYANNGNSSYGTTTILEVSGNRIAGSFINNSNQAIALESGDAGDSIKVGFGGYCGCEGVTEGQEITGAGDNAVSAVAPKDGWLWIDPAHIYGEGGEGGTKIYGVLWDGTSTTALSRTDHAAGFTDPTPALSNGTGSSPFDEIMPWAGMTRVTDTQAGELVAIPKYWYKWTKSGNTLKLQIANGPAEGFHVSPAHADRGDGHGERDVVYVGRYHCASNYKSQANSAPVASITRSSARSSIHNLGSTIWQWDWAMNWTIKMLYLVEFANWDSQAKIGYGCGNGSAAQNTGYTDDMQHHTGTTQAARTNYGLGTQYRNIEGLWDNVYDWVDGCYYSSNGLNIIMNPNNFSDSSGGASIGTPVGGYPTVLSVAEEFDGQWIYPTTAGGSTTTYVPDSWNFNASSPCLYVGGSYGQYLNYGLFYVYCSAASYSSADVGCRLMKLP